MTVAPMMSEQRCHTAIRFGLHLRTRCALEEGHGVDRLPSDLLHEGRGLAQFPYQRIEWLPGDSREYLSERDDVFAWEEDD